MFKQNDRILCGLGLRNCVAKIVCTFVLSLLAVISLGGCHATVGGKKQSLVHLDRIHGEVRLEAGRRIDEQDSGSSSRKGTVDIFEERLTLKTGGNVYHPKLLEFAGSLGFALTQQNIDSDELSQKTNALLDNYSFRASILKDKKFPVSIKTSKSEGLMARQFEGPLQSEYKTFGVGVGARFENWPMRLSYDKTEDSQSPLFNTSVGNNNDAFNKTEENTQYYVSHDFSRLSRLTFEFNRREYTSESDLSISNTSEDRYKGMHTLKFGDAEQYQLNSIGSFSDNQGSGAGTGNKQTIWSEYLHLKHRENLSSSYRFQFTESVQQLFTSTEKFLEARLNHKLYRSLNTSLNGFASNSKTGSSVTTDRYGSGIGFDYTKRNPFGIFNAGFSRGFSKTIQNGVGGIGNIISESHLAISGFIELERPSVEESTIVVHDGSGGIYDQGFDYTVITQGGRTFLQLTAIGGGPNTADFNAPLDGTQTFFVDYNYAIGPEKEEEIDTWSYTLRQSFLNGFSIFLEERDKKENIDSDDVSITPDDNHSMRYGVEYNKQNLSLSAELFEEESTLINTDAKRLRANYRWVVNHNSSLNIYAFNEILNTKSTNSGQKKLFSFGTNYTNQLTERHQLFVDLTHYTDNDSNAGKTSGLKIASTLQYRYRRLLLNVGFEHNILSRDESESTDTYIFARLKRFF